jgi:hypothetical protein
LSGTQRLSPPKPSTSCHSARRVLFSSPACSLQSCLGEGSRPQTQAPRRLDGGLTGPVLPFRVGPASPCLRTVSSGPGRAARACSGPTLGGRNPPECKPSGQSRGMGAGSRLPAACRKGAQLCDGTRNHLHRPGATPWGNVLGLCGPAPHMARRAHPCPRPGDMP